MCVLIQPFYALVRDFDGGMDLPDEIEHHMPDYHLYDEWIEDEVRKAKQEKGDKFNERSFRVQFREYTDYSIGFLTRGCFRKCEFCVNKKYNHVFKHSPLEEFYDPSRKKICLLDDNVLGCPQWRSILQELIALKKPFKFKQGMDERLLTEEKCELLFNANYDGDYTFAFDNISDYDLIHKKLEMIRRHTTSKSIKFYVLVGFEGTGAEDIENAFNIKTVEAVSSQRTKSNSSSKRSSIESLYPTISLYFSRKKEYF